MKIKYAETKQKLFNKIFKVNQNLRLLKSILKRVMDIIFFPFIIKTL